MAQSIIVRRSHGLLLCIGAERFHFSAYVNYRLVERIAQRIASVATNYQPTGLRHEGGKIADRPADDDIYSLHRNAASKRRVPLNDQQAAMRRGARRYGSETLDPHDAGRHAFGD